MGRLPLKRRAFHAFVCLLLAVGICSQASAQVVVAHDDIDHQLSRRRLSDILLGRITTWDDGLPIVLVLVDDQPCATAIATVTGRELPQLLRGWKRLVYSGGGAMPIIVPSPQVAIEEIRRRRGAMTVLSVDPEALGVRVLPLDPATSDSVRLP